LCCKKNHETECISCQRSNHLIEQSFRSLISICLELKEVDYQKFEKFLLKIHLHHLTLEYRRIQPSKANESGKTKISQLLWKHKSITERILVGKFDLHEWYDLGTVSTETREIVVAVKCCLPDKTERPVNLYIL